MSTLSGKKASELQVKIEVLVERVGNLIASNEGAHAEILKQVSNLCGRVNHQQDVTDNRLKALEKSRLTEIAMYKGRIQLLKWLSLGLGITVSVLTIAHLFGVF